MEIKTFRKIVWDFYTKHGRHDLPWRKTHDAYKVLVSEVMLQQTQAYRVIPKYNAFIKKFPTVRSLARAKTADVIKLWQGLGYNRRALNLQRSARVGIPSTYAELLALPGVGPYTASAVMAFAFNKPAVMIETNIRTVFIHHFFPKSRKVSDEKLLPFIQKVLPVSNSREWYWALMDYGAFLKQKYPNPSRRSSHHTKQSRFEGSDRQIRGAILRVLIDGEQSGARLTDIIADTKGRVGRILGDLVKEGFIKKSGARYRIV